MIDKSDLTLRRQVDANAREPFPVAVMAEYACGVLTLAEVLLHFLAVDNRQPLAKLAVADAEQLDSLKEIVRTIDRTYVPCGVFPLRSFRGTTWISFGALTCGGI